MGSMGKPWSPHEFHAFPHASYTREESGEQSQQTSDADVVCNQELIKKVKVNDRIRIRENDQGTWTDVKVLGKGGNSTGRNKFYYNVENESQ